MYDLAHIIADLARWVRLYITYSLMLLNGVITAMPIKHQSTYAIYRSIDASRPTDFDKGNLHREVSRNNKKIMDSLRTACVLYDETYPDKSKPNIKPKK